MTDPISRSILLWCVVLLLLVSFALPLVSVHSYCENRAIAVVFACTALVLSFLLARQVGSSKEFRVVGLLLCLLALATNVLFIAFVTNACVEQQKYLH